MSFNVSQKQVWSYLSSPLAAAAAIVPVFRGFVVSTALQRDQKVPPFIFKQAVMQGLKAAPTVGAVVGIQTSLEQYAEKKIKAYVLPENAPSSVASFLSTCLAGFASSPIYTVLKGQSRDLAPLQALKEMSRLDAAAISARETFFLGGLKMSEPLANAAKEQFGDTKAVQYGSSFVSGAIGAIVGHPFDTALAVKKMVFNKQAFKGACSRTLASGGFTVIYTLVKELIK